MHGRALNDQNGLQEWILQRFNYINDLFHQTHEANVEITEERIETIPGLLAFGQSRVHSAAFNYVDYWPDRNKPKHKKMERAKRNAEGVGGVEGGGGDDGDTAAFAVAAADNAEEIEFLYNTSSKEVFKAFLYFHDNKAYSSLTKSELIVQVLSREEGFQSLLEFIVENNIVGNPEAKSFRKTRADLKIAERRDLTRNNNKSRERTAGSSAEAAARLQQHKLPPQLFIKKFLRPRSCPAPATAYSYALRLPAPVRSGQGRTRRSSTKVTLT